MAFYMRVAVLCLGGVLPLSFSLGTVSMWIPPVLRHITHQPRSRENRACMKEYAKEGAQWPRCVCMCDGVGVERM
jgi:hypothetical protein